MYSYDSLQFKKKSKVLWSDPWWVSFTKLDLCVPTAESLNNSLLDGV